MSSNVTHCQCECHQMSHSGTERCLTFISRTPKRCEISWTVVQPDIWKKTASRTLRFSYGLQGPVACFFTLATGRLRRLLFWQCRMTKKKHSFTSKVLCTPNSTQRSAFACGLVGCNAFIQVRVEAVLTGTSLTVTQRGTSAAMPTSMPQSICS